MGHPCRKPGACCNLGAAKRSGSIESGRLRPAGKESISGLAPGCQRLDDEKESEGSGYIQHDWHESCEKTSLLLCNCFTYKQSHLAFLPCFHELDGVQKDSSRSEKISKSRVACREPKLTENGLPRLPRLSRLSRLPRLPCVCRAKMEGTIVIPATSTSTSACMTRFQVSTPPTSCAAAHFFFWYVFHVCL